MRKLIAALFVAACAGSGLAAVSWARTALPAERGGHPITICHRTDSEHHPYVRVTVDAASTDVAGHEHHTGTVWYPGHPTEPKWGDIIPPTDDDHDRPVPARNWTPTGQALWHHDCAPAFGPPPQPPTITCTTISVDPPPVSYIKVSFTGTVNGRPFVRTVSYGQPVPHLAVAHIGDLTTTTTGPQHITAHATWTLGPGATPTATITATCHTPPPPHR